MLEEYSTLYKNNLLLDVIPFWENHSIDWQYGGYFTCLDREGRVYDQDKFTWLQARQIWSFSMLYNRVESRDSWLQIAQNGVKFLKKHGRDELGNFYFSLNREGVPLTQAYNLYSDCFAALAFNEYARATGDEESLDIAINTYKRFLDRRHKPKGIFDKSTGNRSMKSFGLPMMTAYLSYELSDLLDPKSCHNIYEECVHEIFEIFYNPMTQIIHEHVSENNLFVDSYNGRLVNPGHCVEAMWFVMDVAKELERPQLIQKASDMCIKILDYGWDNEYGGLFYFMDVKNAPLEKLEWNQKLWWVHQEALIALSRSYALTGRKDIWEWFKKVHDYTWSHFPDQEKGEWYGYLNRAGVPHTTLKGGKWKGCFHTPRALYECWQNFENI